METDSFGNLGFRELSYDDGIDEINAFYPPGGSPERESDNAARLAAIEVSSGRTKAIDGPEANSSEDNEHMEDVEHTQNFKTSAESANWSTRHFEHDNSAFNPYDKVTPPQTSDEAGPSRLAEGQTVSPSNFLMEHMVRGDSAATLNISPVPPSSSNRGELQAEMRHEEEDQPVRISNLVPLPFSLNSKDKKNSVAGKREASVSPLAAKRRVRKKAKNGEEDIVPSSPPVFTSSPSKTVATYKTVSLDPAQDMHSPQALAEPEQALQPDALPRDNTLTQHGSNDAPPNPENSREAPDTSYIKLQNPTKRTINGAASKIPQPNHRRPMGSNELRDLIGTDVLKGVHASSGSQRMTRNQKQEREASKPGASAKEAVRKRRQLGGKDAK